MEEKIENHNVVISPEKSKNVREKNSFWHINRELLPYKLHYLFFAGGLGAVIPFYSAFGITVLGLTASNIAACYTAVQVTVFVIKPGFGYIVDYFNRLKSVIVALAVIRTIICFCMISIPNTGMPGIHTLQFTDTSQNNTYCQLCLKSDIFEFIPQKMHMNDENAREVSTCFSNNVMPRNLINCSPEYFKSTNSSDKSLKIMQTTCNFNYTKKTVSEKRADLEGVQANDHSVNILYINNAQISSICILPFGRLFYSMNVSSDDLNQFCFVLSDESIMQLEHLLSKTDLKTINCSYLHKEIYVQQKDEQDISIANFKTYQFWAFVICIVIATTFGSSELTMADTACYESVQGIDFGQQRVWSAISWGLTAPFAGYLNDYTGSYMAAWLVLACCTALQIWNLNRMNLVKPDFTQNILKDMRTILNSLEFLCFGAGVLLNGMCAVIVSFYLTWFIVAIGGNKLIIGLANTMQCFFGEVPVMYISGWLLKKIGHFNLVSLALISHGLRFLLYSYLHNPWWILPIESLHGFTYGSFIVALTSYGKLNSKPGTEATMQSILCTIYEALGYGIGCVVAGACFEYFGCHTTFFYASCFSLIATMINISSTFIISCRKRSQDVIQSKASGERY